MMIRDMFAKDINRPINGVIKVDRVCQEFCVNFFRNLYHTSTLIRSYDHL